MSKDLQDFDMENLSDDDRAYFDQRPWLKDLYERQTGDTFPESGRENSMDNPPSVQQMSARNPGTDTSGDPSGPQTGMPADYSDWEYNDLRHEVSSRNEDREEDDKIVPDSQSKEDLVAALEADDEGSEEDGGE